MDVWSLGVSLSTMLTGALPFQAIGSSELNRKILRGAFILPEWLSAEAADLIHQAAVLTLTLTSNPNRNRNPIPNPNPNPNSSPNPNPNPNPNQACTPTPHTCSSCR